MFEKRILVLLVHLYIELTICTHERASVLNATETINGRKLTTVNLQCRASFEPACTMYPYVRFWNRRFNAPDCFESPARHALRGDAPIGEQKYLIFQPDAGGGNNVRYQQCHLRINATIWFVWAGRMAAETAMIFAHATGRVLVISSLADWYHLQVLWH